MNSTQKNINILMLTLGAVALACGAVMTYKNGKKWWALGLGFIALYFFSQVVVLMYNYNSTIAIIPNSSNGMFGNLFINGKTTVPTSTTTV